MVLRHLRLDSELWLFFDLALAITRHVADACAGASYSKFLLLPAYGSIL